MMKLKSFLYVLVFCASILSSTVVRGQAMEERFHDVAVTAGYATVFGAALGAALLSFHENPAQHLRYVAIGASLGFIGGSIVGSYVVFSPMLTGDNSAPTEFDLGRGRGFACKGCGKADFQHKR